MKRFFRAISVKWQYMMYALKKINKPHLGDIVYHRGHKCFLSQGVSAPYWDLIVIDELVYGSDDKKSFKHVHRKEFMLEKFRKRAWFAFSTSYKFQMSNWYSIDMNQKGKISYRKV